jgi:transcription termination/antitermination protein NusA
MRSEFEVAFNEIAELRSLPRETVLEALRTALISAYKRDAGVGSSQRVEANVDPGTGRARIFVEKEVVDEVQDNRTEVELEKARYYEPEANLGDMVMVQVEGTTKKFGRIAAQTAKQVILQKIREAERNALYDEFSAKEGDVMAGVVQSVNPSMVTVTLNGKAEAILPRAQQIPGERYKPHDKVRIYLLEVKRSNRGPQIIVSRSHRNMLRRLLEYEVPEIYNGQVEIKSIAREAGYRSKVAVAALQEGVDPVGACVGMRGIRIQNIVKELHEEKIDVIEWNPNQEAFISKALSPARVAGVYLEEDPDSGRTAVVIVPDDQLSLAIGREGQNARLAAKLTGWRIDIKSVTEAVQEALDNLNGTALKSMQTEQADMIADVRRIMEKRAANRAVMPEEYTVLGKFADFVQRKQMAARDVLRQQRLAEIQAVRMTLPQAAFQMPVESLGLPENITEALLPLENVGEIMLRFLIDERRLRQLLNESPSDSLARVQTALDKLVLPEYVDPETQKAEAVAEVEEMLGEEQAAAQVGTAEAAEDEELVIDAFGNAVAPTKPAVRKEPEPVVVEETAFEEDEDIDAIAKKDGEGKKSKKKEREQRRQIVFDEDIGEMVVKRRRKGGRDRGGTWGDWEE